MSTPAESANGIWSHSVPIPMTDDFDVEVCGTGPYRWEAWVGLHRVASGRARTRFGLAVALLRAKRRHRRATRP